MSYLDPTTQRLTRQQLWNIKDLGIQSGLITMDARPNYRYPTLPPSSLSPPSPLLPPFLSFSRPPINNYPFPYGKGTDTPLPPIFRGRAKLKSNADGRPHRSQGYGLHITIDWQNYVLGVVRTCHVPVNEQTLKLGDTVWFEERRT